MNRIRTATLALMVLGLAWGAGGAPSTASGQPYNVAAPTLGGSQFWADE